jgi:hypothetical protein
MAGYSGTPLAKKLGIGHAAEVLPLNPPADYEELLAPLPDGVRFVAALTPTTDVVHLFTTDRAELSRVLADYRSTIRPDAILWVSWPKKSSKVLTDITEDVIRDVCLPLGWVDVKVCAVDETWSGLKLVIRKELRGSPG